MLRTPRKPRPKRLAPPRPPARDHLFRLIRQGGEEEVIVARSVVPKAGGSVLFWTEVQGVKYQHYLNGTQWAEIIEEPITRPTGALDRVVEDARQRVMTAADTTEDTYRIE